MREKESLRPIGNARLLQSIGRRCERPDRAAHDAREGGGAPVVGAQALHRQARHRRRHARRPGEGPHGRRGGGRARRRGGRRPDRLPGGALHGGARPASAGRDGDIRAAARATWTFSTRSEGAVASERRRRGEPLDQGAGQPLRARAPRDGGLAAGLRAHGVRGRARLLLRPRGDDPRRGPPPARRGSSASAYAPRASPT